jgi:hypothetical protein
MIMIEMLAFAFVALALAAPGLIKLVWKFDEPTSA